MNVKVISVFIIIVFVIVLAFLIIRSRTRGVAEAALNDFENDFMKMTNDTRASRGLRQLQYDSALVQIARAHSKDMIKRNFFNHINPSGESPEIRARKAKYPYQYIGENIGKGYATPESAFSAWMSSLSHRANLLQQNYTRMGVGIDSGRGTIAYTQLFS